jgi:hypothetical protein
MTKRPEKVIGMHFFNPAPVMQLIEVVRGLNTSEETFQITKDLSVKLGKTPIEAKDFPGFVSSRLIFSYMNENEKAQIQKEITLDSALTARMVAWPLKLYDCSLKNSFLFNCAKYVTFAKPNGTIKQFMTKLRKILHLTIKAFL